VKNGSNLWFFLLQAQPKAKVSVSVRVLNFILILNIKIQTVNRQQGKV